MSKANFFLLVAHYHLINFYSHPPSITIQRKVKRRQVYPCKVMKQILLRCQNYYLCRNNAIIDREIAGKIRRALVEIIGKKIKDELMKSKLHVRTNVSNIFSSLDIIAWCQNYYLCRNNAIIDREIAGKIRRALVEIIGKEIKDELMKSKLHVRTNVSNIFSSLDIIAGYPSYL